MASTATITTSRSSNYDKSMFPLRCINDVVSFFRRHLERRSVEPDLTLLSIIAGYIEISLTSGGSAVAAAAENSATTTGDELLARFPIVTYELVDSLYKKFHVVLESVEKASASNGQQANREVIKKISDIVYYSLFRSTFKDRAHLQSMYTFLSANKLDSFGVAFAVVAACQFLGYEDVHLAISEDHAWVIFGKNLNESIEVTWHGKGNEDKRGQDVKAGVESNSWLYLTGLPVVCNRHMEVAAMVSAINISLTASSDCEEVADLQQKLLWLLYDLGHLKKYPMGLGNLGELEEVSHTFNRPTCEQLYREAIKSGREHYGNHHIYPYTYLGGFYYRLNKYRETLAAWADAGDVLRSYTYNSRDDEEIYKEFSEIANEMIPSIMKTESSGHSARSILRDSECFANLLRFYDGICQWEEGSLTPILHIGWAKPLVSTIAKYEYDIRAQVSINCSDEDDFSTKKFESEAKKEKTSQQNLEGNNNTINKDDIKSVNGNGTKKADIPTLADLTAACGEKILNPEFLLQGGGQPFAVDHRKGSDSEASTANKNPTPSPEPEKKPEAVEESSCIVDDFDFMPKRPVISLYSQKMKGLKDLLLSEKLNTHAISLQVTAQSQVAGKKGRGGTGNVDKSQSTNVSVDSIDATSSRPKRTRRE